MSDAGLREGAAASYRRPYRVRFDEAGPDGLLRSSGLMRYAQDVARRHSDALGFDRAWYAERAVAWLARAAELELLAPIPLGCDLEMMTTVVGFRRVWARRRTEARTAGALVAVVEMDWVFVDRRGEPTRIPPELERAFPGAGGSLQRLRVDLPAAPPTTARRAFRVRPHELDPNNHVNAAAYLDWLEESVLDAVAGGVGPGGVDPRDAAPGNLEPRGVGPGADALSAIPRRYRLEYAAAAGPAAGIVAESWSDGAGWSHRLALAGGAEVLRSRLEA